MNKLFTGLRELLSVDDRIMYQVPILHHSLLDMFLFLFENTKIIYQVLPTRRAHVVKPVQIPGALRPGRGPGTRLLSFSVMSLFVDDTN